MTRLLLSADWHCDEFAYSRHPTMRGDSAYGLKQLIDYAVDPKNKIDAVLAAGDLYENSVPSSITQTFVHLQLARLREAGVAFLFIQAQHEGCVGEPRLACWVDGHYLHNKVVSVGDDEIVVGGLDFQPEGLQEALQSPTLIHADVLMVHQVWENWMGGVTSGQGKLEDLPAVPLVLTGDLHRTETYTVKRKTGWSTTVVSPGSTHMRSINEPQEKFFFVAEFTGKRPAKPKPGWFKLTKVPLKTRQYIRAVLINEEAVDLFLAKWAKTKIDPAWLPYVVLELSEPQPETEDKILDAMTATAFVHFYQPTKKRKKGQPDDDSPESSEELSIDDALKEVVDENSPEYRGLQRFLSDPNHDYEAVYGQLESDFRQRRRQELAQAN